MSANAIQTLKVKMGDLECPICAQGFDITNRLPVSLLCGHTLCSQCLAQIKKCPTCREEIEKNPRKNTMICSLIEAYSSYSSKTTCSLHSLPCEVLCPKIKEFVCAECFIMNDKEIPTLKSINAKVLKIQENEDEINRKRQSAIDSLEELLLQDKNNAEQTILDTCDEELARVLSVKKKQKKDVETDYYSKKERYEHELLATDLVKYLKNNGTKLKNWQKNQDSKTATEIIETDLETGKEMENFDKKVNELKTAIQASPKLIFQRSQNQIQEESSQQQLASKSCAKAEYHYLCQTFEDYGFTTTYDDYKDGWFNVFALKKSETKPLLNRFHPKYFDCTLERLDLRCLNNHEFNFGIVCDVLENIVSLSGIKLEFLEPPSSEFELLPNLILRLNDLKILSVKFSVTQTSISCFLQFLTTLLSLNKTSQISVYSVNGQLTSQIFLEPRTCSLKCFQVKNIDDGDDHSSMRRESFEAISKLLKSMPVPLERFAFDFNSFAKNPASLQYLSCFLENLPNLLNLQLRMANPSLLKNNLLNRVIFEGIIKHPQLKTLDLFIPGDSEENNSAINELCGQFENTKISNNNLQELNLTFYNFKNLNLRKILIFISCFCQLKILKLRFYKVKKNYAMICEFFGGIHEIKCEEFSFEFFTHRELTSNQLQDLKALLPSSLPKSTVVFEKLSSKTANQCYVSLKEDEIAQDEDDE